MMRAPSVRRASRYLIPALGLASLIAVSQAASATAPPTSPPDTEPGGSEPMGSAPMGSEPPSTLPDGYVWLVDDTGAITVGVPDTWTDIDTTPETDESGAPLPRIAAAPDIDEFRETFNVPGVEFIAAPFEEDPEATIEEFGLTSGCDDIVVEPYEDPVFTGFVQVGTACGETSEATWNFVVASPEDGSFTAFVQVQTATAADEEALQIVLDTFNVAPEGAVPGTSVPSSSVPGGDTMVDTTPADTGVTETTETS